MTLFGKILAVFCLAISVPMSIAAVLQYFQRVNWPAVLKEEQSDVAALWDGTATRDKDVNSPYLVSEKDWSKSLKAVEDKERERPNYHKWYQEKLANLRSGEEPVEMVRIDEKTFVPVIPNPKRPGEPQMDPAKDRDGNPLRSLKIYNDYLKDLNTKLAATLEEYQKLVKEDAILTDRLIGDKGKKGLHKRLAEERVKREGEEPIKREGEEPIKREGVVGEIKLVKSQLINASVESELIVKRRNSLKARIAELEKAPVAVRK